MFGPKITTVFASRWRALWFAGSVLLFVYVTIPEAEPVSENGQQVAERGVDGLTDKERQQAAKALAAFENAANK